MKQIKFFMLGAALITGIGGALAFNTTATTFYGVKVGTDAKWTTVNPIPNGDECLSDAVALACSIQSDRPVAEVEALTNQFPSQYASPVDLNKIYK
ncbi:hypothetical protein [uncultured Chitinophaga sp.]|uniref:hypothetical protein n=1 Tax=uncultured Chitinophaga sp. TaxID=339340 RepID=UPI0025E458E8|nr:hypothetical protein [uncultured Chitinophaga sp.]